MGSGKTLLPLIEIIQEKSHTISLMLNPLQQSFRPKRKKKMFIDTYFEGKMINHSKTRSSW